VKVSVDKSIHIPDGILSIRKGSNDASQTALLSMKGVAAFSWRKRGFPSSHTSRCASSAVAIAIFLNSNQGYRVKFNDRLLKQKQAEPKFPSIRSKE
jgi:hypothetical protein